MFLSNKALKGLVVVIIAATTGVSAFLHNGHQLRLLQTAGTSSSFTKEPMLGLGGDDTNILLSTHGMAATKLYLAPMDGIVQVYTYASTNYYLATQAATMSLFSGMGDCLAQILERRALTKALLAGTASAVGTKPTSQQQQQLRLLLRHDWNRTKRFLMKGIGCGLIWTAWYQIAELWSNGLTGALVSSLTTLSPQTLHRMETVIYTIVSIALEQFVASPIIYGLWDIPLLSFLHGTPLAKIPAVVRQKLLPLLIANAKLWTVVNVLIYNVPLKFRVVALSCADLVWQTILSSKLASPNHHLDDHGTNGADTELVLPLVSS